MARQLSKIIRPLTALLSPTTAPPPLPAGLSYEIQQSDRGGAFTGNVVIAAPRTETGLLADLVRNFAPLVSLSPSGIATNIASTATKQILTPAGSGFAGQKVGEVPMGFFDDLFDSGGSVFDSGQSPIDFGGILNTGVSLLPQLFGNQSMPTQVPTQLAMTPTIVGAGGAVARMGGAIASRFPQLTARLATLGMSRAAAFGMLKKFGPAALTGIGFAAVEVAQLASSGSGRRRMNICNGRALRRANRRVQAFHNFYKRTCGTPSIRRRKRC